MSQNEVLGGIGWMIIREGRGFRIEGRVQRTSQTDEMILEMIERACDFRESSSEDSIIRVPPEAEETRTDFS